MRVVQSLGWSGGRLCLRHPRQRANNIQPASTACGCLVVLCTVKELLLKVQLQFRNCGKRVVHVAGEMFGSVPSGDAVLMKVIVIQSVLLETPESTPASLDSFTIDMIILVNFKGGKERTEQEYAKLGRDAGFTGGFQSTYIFCNIYALEFTK
uniref:O-methyltransferase C-terminal domain-containing protein n=1 Tax=Setaria italica TaxID=4555 RepID=K3ZMG7_SETIT